jgi:pyruvate formate lyase activating enzyme
MNIASWRKCSFVDFPGKISLVLYVSGCNMRCYYCESRSRFVERPLHEAIPSSAIIHFLKEHRELINAVVISGGEPTMQKDLVVFLRELRSLDLALKLDTNGSHPSLIQTLLKEDLLDYISLDIKAPRSKLRHVVGVAISPEIFNRSIEVIRRSGIEYEFRTTVLPEFTRDDILEIAASIRGAKRFTLQQFRKPEAFPRCRDPYLNKAPHPASFLFALEEELTGWFDELNVRGLGESDYVGKDSRVVFEAARQSAA